MEAENVESRVRHALAEVIDPETGLSIMRMDLIHNIQIAEDGGVSLVFRPSSPVCPMAYALAGAIKKKVEAVIEPAALAIRVENFDKAAHLESVLRSTVGTIQRKVD
ncbi:MAG: iron-sulfur cluster assembly protein [Pseudomonadota bacterium]